MKLYIVNVGATVSMMEQNENKNTASTFVTDRPLTFREYETHFSFENDQYHFISKKTHYYVDVKDVKVFG